jgi:GT2 family glycosyltransferase
MAVFDRIGTFDETYFVYFEDTDLFLRMQRYGLRLMYVPAITIMHKISLSTGGTQSDFSIKHYQRNQIYCLRKHFGVITLSMQIALISAKNMVRLIAGKDGLRQFRLRFSGMVDGLFLKLPGGNAGGQASP